MTPSRFLTFPLITLLLLAGVACDTGTEPEAPLRFDPLEYAGAVGALQVPLQASTSALINLRQAIPGLSAAGIQLDQPATEFFGAAFRAASLTYSGPVAPPLAAEIPTELLGSTFVYEAATESWVVDETREAAPAAGIRIIWYAVAGSKELVEPVQEEGYMDLLPGSNTPTDPVVLEVVSMVDPVMTLMDFGQWHDTTRVDGVRTEDFGASGLFADSSATVQFSLLQTETSDAGTGDVDFQFDTMLDGPATVYTLEATGTVDGATDASDDLIMTATVVRDAGTVVMDLTAQLSGDVLEDASGTLAHDGTVVVDISLQGDAFEFTRPGGGEIPASQANDLNLLFQSLLSGFKLIARIPLFFLL